jgi:hypothetical protein
MVGEARRKVGLRIQQAFIGSAIVHARVGERKSDKRKAQRQSKTGRMLMHNSKEFGRGRFNSFKTLRRKNEDSKSTAPSETFPHNLRLHPK